MFSQQETFDKVVNHLRKQNCRCMDSQGCAYRGENNMKCAAGFLIPDEVYSPELERESVRNCGELSRAGHLIIGLGHDIDLVFDLQLIHDGGETEDWEKEFKRVAEKYNLVYTPYVSLQNTFDKVVAHLRQQNCRAMDEILGCRYRGENNTKCAAGCLIPDELYQPEMEGEGFSGTGDMCLAQRILHKLGYDTYFVKELQSIHDRHPVKDWETQFEKLAQKYSLKYQPLEVSN